MKNVIKPTGYGEVQIAAEILACDSQNIWYSAEIKEGEEGEKSEADEEVKRMKKVKKDIQIRQFLQFV